MRKALAGVCTVLLVMALAWIQVSAAQNAKKITVSMKDDGTKVLLEKGNILEVKLPETAGTGYSWSVRSGADGCLKTMGAPKTENAQPEKKSVGTVNHQIFKFETPATGTTKLEMAYARPWEKDKPPAKTFSLTVEVH